jgi:1A family penicillin-binding protein
MGRVSVAVAERFSACFRRHRSSVARVAAGLGVILAIVVGAGAWFVRDLVVGLPSDVELRGVGTMAQSTTLFDVHDRPAFTIFREQRIEVPLDRVSPHLVDAILAIEDQRFYAHSGVDLVRVLGAAWTNVRQGRVAQGGSTITQQLARQSFLTRDKTLRRKLREVVVAARLEREFTKDEILHLYLNKVYFGDGLHGVEAASLGYFGKPAATLDVAEAALLAGLVQSPSTYAPTASLERAIARRNVVLRAMRGFGVIDDSTYEVAVSSEVVLTDGLRREEAYGQYFKEEVRKQLVQWLGWEQVYEGGLRVYTTIDLGMQKAAEAEIARGLEEIETRQARQGGDPTEAPLQAALLAMDPRSGEVRAMVGGRDFGQSPFNRAVQARRQPGSAFKPFVYATALERGYSPASLLTNLDDPIMTLEGEWVPEDERLDTDSLTMRTALRVSSNRAAVRMLDQIGVAAAAQSAEQLGMGPMPRVPSLALGSGEVTLMSMTAAYAAFANAGMLPTATLIRRVESLQGEVLYEAVPSVRQTFSEATAFQMTMMMADVIDGGTAWTARRAGFRLPAAGKTGTTNDYHDVWFVGYTPHLVAGVWVGYDQPRTILRNGYAGEVAVPVWGRFMKTATEGAAAERFQAPETVTSARICRLSGQRATDACDDVHTTDSEGNLTRQSMAYTEYFVHGTEPTDDCPLHRPTIAPGAVAVSGSPAEILSAPAAPPPAAAPGVVTGGTLPMPSETAVQEEPPRRRGFWSRVFGTRRTEDRQVEGSDSAGRER